MTQTAARRAAFSGPVPKIDLSGQRFAVKKVDNVDYSVENISKTDTVYPQLSNFRPGRFIIIDFVRQIEVRELSPEIKKTIMTDH